MAWNETDWTDVAWRLKILKNFLLPAYEVEFCDPDEITIHGVNHGFINSENYPNPYDEFLYCNITFLPAEHELSMELYVHDFHTERFYDFLTIVTSYDTNEYHGNGANIALNPDAMEIGETYYCEYTHNAHLMCFTSYAESPKKLTVWDV